MDSYLVCGHSKRISITISVTSMITDWIEDSKILWPVYQNYNKTLERTSIIEFNCGRSWKMTENDVYVKVKRKKMLALRDRLQVIPKLSWLLTMQNNKKSWNSKIF